MIKTHQIRDLLTQTGLRKRGDFGVTQTGDKAYLSTWRQKKLIQQVVKKSSVPANLF